MGFLIGVWRQGMFIGANTEQAFYVVCDESNNSAEDVIDGKLSFITFTIT